MTRRPTGRPHRTARLAATVLGAAALLVSGCSAGAITQTGTSVPAVTGSEGEAGQMLLRDIVLDPGPVPVVPAGSTVTLRGSVVNNGVAPDELVSVTSPYFGEVSAEGQTTIAGNTTLRIVGSEPVPVGPPTPETPVATARILMNGAAQVLNEGPTYPVVFTFANAGSVTVPVPVSSSGPVPAS